VVQTRRTRRKGQLQADSARAFAAFKIRSLAPRAAPPEDRGRSGHKIAARKGQWSQVTDLRRIWRLAIAVWYAIDERHLGVIAAGVAFYGMFAVFPGMAAMIAIWGFFSDPGVIPDYMSAIHGVMPEVAYDVLETQLVALLKADSHTLGWTTIVSLLVALYSIHAGVAALISALNAINGHRPHRGVRRFAGSVSMTVATLGLAIIALATVVFVPVALNFLDFGRAGGLFLKILPWIVLILVLLAFLGMVYRWGPNRDGARFGWLTPGSLLAVALWAVASIAFSVYLGNFGSYNRIYGSIGAVIALLMWFYISAYIVLLGAVLNAEHARLGAAQ
jgi:membrane protein